MFLKQSTQVVVKIGPYLDKTDGVTEEVGLAGAGTEISKSPGTAFGAGPTLGTHDAEGWYPITLTTSHTDTVGRLVIKGHDSATHIPVWHEFYVLEEATFDALFGASAAGFDANQRVNVGQMLSQAVTLSSDNRLRVDTAEWNDIPLATTNPLPNAAADAAGGLPISDLGGLDLDGLNTNVSAILSDTGTDGVVVAAGSKTGYSLTATTGLGNQTADITGNLSGSVGSVTGAVGSVTGAVGSVTGNVGGNVVGSVGSVTGHTPQTGDSFARLGAPAGASVSADIAAIQTDTDDIQTRLPAVLTTGTADSGSTTTMVDAARTEADNDYWKGGLIRFTSGTISGQVRVITGFTAASDTITFSPATTQAVGTNTYEILPAADVNRVILCDTTTTNTDMRGTDSAALASVCTEARLAELDAGNIPSDVDAILVDTGTTLDNHLTDIKGTGFVKDTDSLTDIRTDTDLIDDGTSGLAKIATDVAAVLVDTADMQPKLGTITDLGGGATLGANNSDMAGATFSSASDSQEAIRDRGDAAWITGSGTGLTALASGTAQSGTASTIVLAVGETFGDDILNGNVVKITGGTGAGQSRLITDYTGASDTATVTPNWTTNPSSDSTYEIVDGTVQLAAYVASLDFTTTQKASINTEADTAISDAALATATALATAQADLDTITGSDGVTLATAQGNYAPSVAGDQMDLVNAPNATAVTAIQSGLATSTAVGDIPTNAEFYQGLDKIWVDAGGSSGTNAGVNGIPSNPCPLADALTIATATGIKTLVLRSNITLAATLANFTIESEGQAYQVTGGSQDVGGSTFKHVSLTGVFTSSTVSHAHECRINTSTLPAGMEFSNCEFQGVTVTLGTSGYRMDRCDFTSTTFDFGAATGNTAMRMLNCSGTLTIQNLGASGTDTLDAHGRGTLTLHSSCVGGTLVIRGDWGLTNNGSGITITRGGTGLTEAGGTGDQLTAVPWNAAWDAEVQSEATDALNAYDPPTKTEMDTLVGTPAGADVSTDIAAIKTVVDTIASDLPVAPTKNVALANFPFAMIDSTDDISLKTGLSVTGQIRKDSGSFISLTNAVTEIGSTGVYTVDLTAAEMNADTVALLFTATGANSRIITIITQTT